MVKAKAPTNTSHVLYHVSRTPEPLQAFEPFSHFGTAKAALDRGMGDTVSGSATAWLHEVRISAAVLWQLPDHEGNNPSPLPIAEVLYYETRLKRLTDADRVRVARACGPIQWYDAAAGYAALAGILAARHCHALVYRNLHEDFGNMSLILPDPARATVLRAVDFRAVLEVLAARGCLPERGRNPDPSGAASAAIIEAMDAVADTNEEAPGPTTRIP